VEYDVKKGDSATATLSFEFSVPNSLSDIPTDIRERVPMKINVDSGLRSQEIIEWEWPGRFPIVARSGEAVKSETWGESGNYLPAGDEAGRWRRMKSAAEKSTTEPPSVSGPQNPRR